jgi:DNA-binding MarR family transcriptional regulator
MSIKLTATQQAILNHAHQHTAGRIDWYPETLKGGAKAKTVESMVKAGLISKNKRATVMTKAAYAALGIEPPLVESKKPDQIKTRENSKQAQVIALLKRPEGATITQICEATGWQPHTVRGAFAGSLKKKLGLTIVSVKDENAERVYRIAYV